MSRIFLRIINVLNNRFTKKVYFYRPPTFWSAFEIKINILVQWAIKTVIDSGSNKVSLRTTKMISGTKKKKNALVLGNGPTVKNLNFVRVRELKLIEELEIFTVNYGLLDEDIQNLEPNYLVLSDEMTMPNALDERTTLLWKMVSGNKKIVVITPTSWHSKFDELKECKNDSCLHFKDSSLEGISISTSPLRARGYSSMTTYKALAFAVHLGYSEIFCAGIDNSGFKSVEVNEHNHLIQNSRHLNETYMKSKDISVGYPNGMCDYLADYASLFYTLRRCFESKQIINLAIDSELDVFRKIKREDSYFFLVN